eukprot:364746-Chlamydomonas_euryale.AAC.7
MLPQFSRFRQSSYYPLREEKGCERSGSWTTVSRGSVEDLVSKGGLTGGAFWPRPEMRTGAGTPKAPVVRERCASADEAGHAARATLATFRDQPAFDLSIARRF